jgi:hypothetical protein
MASVDARVAAVLDHNTQHDSDDEDALIAELEQDDSTSLVAFREQRLQQLHAELSRAKAQRNSDYGQYIEIKDEKQLMDITTSSKLCVVHFMKPDFNRCRIMDQKLAVSLLSRISFSSPSSPSPLTRLHFLSLFSFSSPSSLSLSPYP